MKPIDPYLMRNLVKAVFVGFLKETYTYQIGGIMLDRLLKNWKTTMEAVIPGIAVIVAKFGFQLDLVEAGAIAAMIYAIILLFSKDPA